VHPILIRNQHGPLLRVTIDVAPGQTARLASLEFSLDGTDDLNDIEAVQLFATGDQKAFSTAALIGEAVAAARAITLPIDRPLVERRNVFWLSCRLRDSADLQHQLSATCSSIATSVGVVVPREDVANAKQRIGVALRRHHDDGVHTYRIPALTTSSHGTLLAVYDMRRRAGRDLQEDIDIGLSRSTDGGRTWESSRVIMDMGTYGGLPQEQEPAFRKFFQEGRLAIVGGTDVMPDVNMPGGESFVRQVLYGKGYFRQKLGVDVTVGWQLDTFGHHAQMPQLLKLGGYKSFWFFRGVPDMNTPSEFLWEGIDGSRIPAFWLPQGYAHTYGSPQAQLAFSRWMKRRFDSLGPQCPFSDRVGLAGADVCEPEEHVPVLVEQHNRTPDALEWKFAALPKSLSAELTASGDVPQANFARVSEYEAETMPHQGGSEEADAEAGNQRTWVARPTRDKPSFLVFGPYDELPPGTYLTVYRMRLLETTDKDIATIDASIGGDVFLGSRKLTAGDLPTGKFASVPLMIDVTERHRDGRLEFRVSWHGNASLALDSITVFRLERDASKPQGPQVAPLELRIAVPADYEKAVAARPDRPVIKGELNPIFQGTYSSRIELKQQTRELERLLTTAEKLGVLCNWLGVPADDQAVWRAWEPVLFNQAHDLASGVMTDRVYDDTLSSNYFSRRLAVEFVDTGLERVAAKIDTQGDGIPLVVWNTLGWSRTDRARKIAAICGRSVGRWTAAAASP